MSGVRSRSRAGALRVGICAALLLTIRAPTSAQSASPAPALTQMDGCAPAAGQPWTQERLMCLYNIGTRDNTLAETRARLQRLGAGQLEHPWPTFVLGLSVFQDDETRALALYDVAARGFARVGDAEGEVIARHNLRNIYQRRGNSAAANRQVVLAKNVAETSGQPLPLARAAVLEAGHELRAGGDVGRAYQTLRRAEPFAFPDGPIGLRRAILMNLANASLYLGRLDDAIDALERHRALRKVDGATTDAATVAFNLLNARLTKQEQRPRPGARERLAVQAREVLVEAERLRRPRLVASTHRVLADLLRTSDPATAAEHLDRCLALERTLGYPELRAGCLWTRSLLDARRDPVRAERESRAAIEALADNPDSLRLVYAWQARLRLAWQTMPEDEAMRASLQALDAVERLRARQENDDRRAELFSSWTRDYYWLAGRLLDARTPRVAEAFEVGERLRARELLEHLTRAGLQNANPPSAASGDATPASVASLADVQRALDESEALLWFSVAPWEDVYGDFGGGAWLVVVTRHASRLHRLSATADLDSRVAALEGLLRDRDTATERWAPAAGKLGRVLLGSAMKDLPPAIRRLVIISDGELHRLPFEALRPAGGHAALGQQFEITLAPSATLWLRLRNGSPLRASDAALVLADPELTSTTRRGDVALAALPFARREARSIARTLHLGANLVREGGAASEQFLKQAPLARFGVLHLATHAQADAAFPERSAVFLAPGGATEDGRLQPREIAALDFHGRLVVLSACDSASGFLLSGEGPLSLARAFFAGGAGAVVATRWPLRDDDAAFMMERFYEALASGAGAAAALRHAREQAIAAGLPAAAWAGVGLMGDGVRPPFPHTTSSMASLNVTTIAAVGIIIAALVAAVIRLRRQS
jgi:tetratricopeptide (TPR) repeat protein